MKQHKLFWGSSLTTLIITSKIVVWLKYVATGVKKNMRFILLNLKNIKNIFAKESVNINGTRQLLGTGKARRYRITDARKEMSLEKKTADGRVEKGLTKTDIFLSGSQNIRTATIMDISENTALLLKKKLGDFYKGLRLSTIKTATNKTIK